MVWIVRVRVLWRRAPCHVLARFPTAVGGLSIIARLAFANVVDDLTTGGTTVPLSAEQGKVLKGLNDTNATPSLLFVSLPLTSPRP